MCSEGGKAGGPGDSRNQNRRKRPAAGTGGGSGSGSGGSNAAHGPSAKRKKKVNTGIFVSGLPRTVLDVDLRLFFTRFGTVTYVKIYPGGKCFLVEIQL